MNAALRIRLGETGSFGSVSFEKLATFLSLVIPALIRWIPETQLPYPIGFDTPLYISWARHYASNPTIFPLMLPLLGLLHALGLDMVVVMKYLPMLLYGFLGFCIYHFSHVYLGWCPKKSFIAVLLIALSFVSLRVSWDMHKQLMGTAFLMLALSYLRKLEKIFGFVAFGVFGFLAAFSHEFVFAVLMAVLTCWVLFVVRKEPKKTLPVLALIVGFLLLFVGVWYGWRIDVISENALGTLLLDSTSLAERWLFEATNNVSLFLQLYGLTLFFVVLGSFKDKILLPWLCLGLIGSFSMVVFPLQSGVSPFRWMFLLVYPFSFYAANGFDRLHFLMRRRPKSWSLILLLLAVNIPTWGFLGFVRQSPYFWKPNVLPETMALSSIPLSDIEVTIWLTKKFDEVKGSVLIVHGHYFGWASYFTEKKVVTFGELYGRNRNINQAVKLAQSENAGDIYLLWYLDSDAYSSGFTKIAEKGPMKLYKYVKG